MARSYFNPKKRANFFEKILVEVPDTNSFDLSHPNKLSFNMGELVPVLVQECYPGDKFNIRAEHLIKMAPLVFPTFHKVKVKLEAFYVRNRLLWDGFEEYTSYNNLNEVPEHPYIDLYKNTSTVPADTGINRVTSLADYMGIPTGNFHDQVEGQVNHPLNKINALPFAAYFKIYDEYYRDQNLSPELWRPLTDGDNSDNEMFLNATTTNQSKVFKTKTLLMRAWEKDYFTSALPFAQKGNDVVMPLGEEAELQFIPGGENELINPETGANFAGTGGHGLTSINGEMNIDDVPAPGQSTTAIPKINNNWIVNLRNATAATISSLRIAIRMQEFFERNAVTGSRYVEQLWGRWGVRSSDAVQQRPELIGYTETPLIFSEVLQTSETETTPLAQQAGHGQAINNDALVNHYCEEHGWIIVLASIIPETNYFTGLDKKFVKEDVLSYYDPMFANLGEEPVRNYELFVGADASIANATFGYQSRFANLKYSQGQVHGEFRTELRPWHMAREFTQTPMLNHDFIESDPTHNIFADTNPDTQKMYAYMHFNITARRKLPYYSTPSLEAFGK